MNTQRLLSIAFCALIAGVSGAGILSAQTTKSDLTGRIAYLDGTVKVNDRVADTGDRLSGVVVIQTGAQSEVEVIFGDQNIFRLGASTTIKIDFSAVKKTVTLQKGLFTSVLKKLAKLGTDASFELKTPTVNAGVRGTSFHVTADEKHTYFCTCNGSVDLKAFDSAQVVNLTNAHHGSRIFTKQADGSIKVEVGGLEDHTDASIDSLAGRIGVTTDWSKPDLSTHTP